MFVFDTETRIDASQRLTFGSYQFIVSGRCLEEGLFYADDLPVPDRKLLENYFKQHKAEMANEGIQWRLLTRSKFLKRLFKASYKLRCLTVGFNLPFDLSRIAFDFTKARGRYTGGFSLTLWSYFDDQGDELADRYRPNIGIKHINSKCAWMGFTRRTDPDKEDLIPEDSETGELDEKYVFPGYLLDLRTFAFALTDVGYSLETACEAFGVTHPKKPVAQHGIVTDAYIDYNRNDVLATAELALKLLEEYDEHPIAPKATTPDSPALQATKAYSPAAIGKAYLRGMGINPILERQPDFPEEYLGYAQSAFFGGRTSAHIRKVSVPVVSCDFQSMYPTVNSLMNLWKFVTAAEIKVIGDCQDEIEKFLGGLTADTLFNPATWKQLTAFVRIVPDGDILPTRARYSVYSNDWQVGLNHLYAQSATDDELWFSLPDIVASVLLTGRVPKIVDGFRIEAQGVVSGLIPTKLRGVIDVDPSKQDFFKIVVEERKRLSARTDLSDIERNKLNKALKVLANAASFGIYAEMNRQESARKVNVICHGIDAEPYPCRVAHPDVPGEYYFAPLASLITGAARLMLALLESCVTELGGTYAMEDTDSMAIVATKNGEIIPCEGGPHRIGKKQHAIKALSWEQVYQISQRFAALNPFDPTAIKGSILKIEDDNFDLTTKKQRQLYCFAISAKRYVLFLKDVNGAPVLLQEEVNNEKDRWSEHGLGHLLNPTDPQSENRDWIRQVWLDIVSRDLGFESQNLHFRNMPAIGRITVSGPAVMRPLEKLNVGKKYADQIKPFNFLLTCHVKKLGHPTGADPAHFHLVAPYSTDSQKWLKDYWIDQYTGKRYRINTSSHSNDRRTASVKRHSDVLLEYEFHPESKCADWEGKPCGRQTVGMLQRRHIRIDEIKPIGKESNSLEEVDAGLIHSPESVYTDYPNARRDKWQREVVPALKKVPLSRLMKVSGLSRRTLIDARTGRRRPHPKNQKLIADIVRKLGLT